MLAMLTALLVASMPGAAGAQTTPDPPPHPGKQVFLSKLDGERAGAVR